MSSTDPQPITSPPMISPRAWKLIVTLSVLLNIVYLVFWFGGHVILGIFSTFEFDGYLFNGSYQLYNPLRRIDAGQRAGADFPCFHGILIPYLHYPLYAMLGKDFFASELARYIVPCTLCLIATAWPAWVITRRICPAFLLTVTLLYCYGEVGLGAVSCPQHSGLATRSFFPVILFTTFFLGLSWWKEAFIIGILAGLSLATGSEQGMASLVGVGWIWFLRAITRHTNGSFRSLAITMGTAIGAYLGILVVIAGPAGAGKVLHYTFVSIPADQFWYFGTPMNEFVDSPASILEHPYWFIVLATGTAFAFCGAIWAWRAKRGNDYAIRIAGMGCYAGLSTFSYLGYTYSGYIDPGARMEILVVTMLLWQLFRALPDTSSLRKLNPEFFVVIQLFVIQLQIIQGVFPSLITLFNVKDCIAQVEDRWATVWKREHQWCPDIQDNYDRIKHHIRETGPADRPPVIWSIYAGQVEADLKVFHPYMDYVIHALGKQARPDYLQHFRESNPDFVITFQKSYFFPEEWLQNCTWPFYENIILNYDLVLSTKYCHLWKRRAGLWREPAENWGDVLATTDGRDIRIETGPWHDRPGEFLVMDVGYSIENLVGWVPVLGQMPRYLLHPQGSYAELEATVPPYLTHWQMPIYPRPGQQPSFTVASHSLFRNGSIRITDVKVRRLSVEPRVWQALVGAGEPVHKWLKIRRKPLLSNANP